ncbi:MAG: hypothetical protein AB1483_11910 [Candidatus Zixiibacteriota bacterium]
MHKRAISRNRKLIAFLLMSGIVALTLACKSQELRSVWVDKGITVDGKIDDWSGLPTTYFEDQSAVVGLCNGADNLYIQLRTRDPKYAGLIKRTGLTIYVDNEGSKNKDFYVKFYAGPKMTDMRGPMGAPEEQNGDDQRPQMRERFGGPPDGEQPDRLLCYVKDRIAEMSISPLGDQGPKAVYDTSMGFYCYEFAIPLGESIVRHYGIDSQPGRTISIGAVWGEVNFDDARKQIADRTEGMPGGGMPPDDGMPGGGFPGDRPGGMGGGPPGGRNMPQKQEIWFKTTLAPVPGNTAISE